LSLLQLFRRGFDPASPRTSAEIGVFLLVFTIYEFSVHELAPVLGGYVGYLAGLNPPEQWQERVFSGVFYLALGSVVLLTLRVFHAWRGRAYIASPDLPPRMRGLIANLSHYSPLNPKTGLQCRFATLEDLNHEIEDLLQAGDALRIGAFRHEILKSNFGPLYVALEYHAPMLVRCWITTTPQTESGYAVASLMLRLITGGRAECDQNSLEDANDVSAIGRKVRNLYETGLGNLRPEDVIVDITSGTAAMSAGLVLASLSEERRVQYLRQDIPLVRLSDAGETALTADEIASAKVLQYVRTSPEDVRSVVPLKGEH
jgi:hypothetical protein